MGIRSLFPTTANGIDRATRHIQAVSSQFRNSCKRLTRVPTRVPTTQRGIEKTLARLRTVTAQLKSIQKAAHNIENAVKKFDAAQQKLDPETYIRDRFKRFVDTRYTRYPTHAVTTCEVCKTSLNINCLLFVTTRCDHNFCVGCISNSIVTTVLEGLDLRPTDYKSIKCPCCSNPPFIKRDLIWLINLIKSTGKAMLLDKYL